MFKCGVTGKVTAPGEPMTRVTLEVRKVNYENLVKRVDPETEREYTEKVLSQGTEIVREIGVSAEGLLILEGKKDGEKVLH